MKLLQDIKVPQESVNDETVAVIELFYQDGDAVEEGDILIELETSKALFTIEAENNGYVKYFCKEGDDVKVNSTIIKIFDSSEVSESIESEKPKEDNLTKTFKTVFSASAISLLKEKNLNASTFNHLDFVSTEDILQHINPNRKKASEKKPENTQKQKVDILPDTILEKLSKTKITEIQYLSDVQQSGLTSTVNIYVDTKNVFDFMNPSLKYLKNSLLPVITFEVSKLLTKYPEFNAYFATESIAIYTKINVGIAIDMDLGLKTVKIAHTNKKTIKEIENEIFELSNKYIDKKLQLEELTNITFTITDLSGEGVSFFRPLINKNNSAILAISANDELLNRTVLSLTFDHRVTDGRKATIFLRELKNRIESYKSDSKSLKIKCFKCMKKLSEDYNDVGFLKTITSDGTEKYICQTCFNGF